MLQNHMLWNVYLNLEGLKSPVFLDPGSKDLSVPSGRFNTVFGCANLEVTFRI